MDIKSWKNDLWRRVRLRMRYEAIYLWPGWPALSAFNVGHAPARAEILANEHFRHQATNIEVYAGLVDLVRSRVVLDAGSRVVEIGCGRGAGLAYLAGQVPGRVAGVDNALAAVMMARRNGLKAFWRDGGHLPGADGTLDAVLAVETVMIFGLADRVLPEARRALKPGGVLALAEFRLGRFADAQRDIDALARAHGFTVVALVDRTEGACRAVMEDEPRRRAVYDRLPAFAQREMADTLSLAGTPRYASWVQGRRCYVFALLTPAG